MTSLVLIRHGQSQWNLENRFTGWTDVHVTDAGRADAELCGKSLKDINFDVVFLSRLARTKETFEGFQKGYGVIKAEVISDSAINEKHYGDLQGMNKAEAAKKFGEDKVMAWRRSYDVRPPNGESVEDVERRIVPFFKNYVLPHLVAGKNILMFAHGNSMRPLMKLFENLPVEKAATMEIDCSVPYVYEFEGEKVVKAYKREVPGMVVKGTATIQPL